MPTDTTDTTCTVTESQCCASTGVHPPVYAGYGMHICALVRHECVEWGLVSTQDRHKYNTCHSLFCPGNTNHHTNLSFTPVCIRYLFPVQNKEWHVLYMYTCTHIYTHMHISEQSKFIWVAWCKNAPLIRNYFQKILFIGASICLACAQPSQWNIIKMIVNSED